MRAQAARERAQHALAQIGAVLAAELHRKELRAVPKKRVPATRRAVQLDRTAARRERGAKRAQREPGLQPRRAPAAQPLREARLGAAGKRSAREYEHPDPAAAHRYRS